MRIQTTLADYVPQQVAGGVRDIILVGHSQGGSVAEMLGVAYQLQYPAVRVSVRAFNQPRSGNPRWAGVVESQLGDRFSFAVRTNDRTARSPSSPLFWAHPAGEVYLPVGAAENGWVTCPGRENPKCLNAYKGDTEPAADGDP
jgi:pimeloyl-ACP methyl ester carboxylesterase